MKVAIVHDFLNQYGGAEKVLEAFHGLFPEAPVYTLIYNPPSLPPDFKSWRIRTPRLITKLPFLRSHYQKYLPLYPTAIEEFDLRGFDLVLSSSYLFAKGVLTPPSTCHISYCHTPMRPVWNMYPLYLKRSSLPIRLFLPFIFNYLRLWDFSSSQRVDHFLASSRWVAQRIKKYYGRESEVIYPPVDTAGFSPSEELKDHYLVVSRLVPYKRIDLAVQAFNLLGYHLKIVGKGAEERRLRALAHSNIKFLGWLPRERLAREYAGCQALIFPGEEDFGIVPVEAQASGRPVIAYGIGGARETVVEGKTGIFFNHQTPQSLIEAIRRFQDLKFDPQDCVVNAQRFTKEVFVMRIKDFVEEKLREYQVEENAY